MDYLADGEQTVELSATGLAQPEWVMADAMVPWDPTDINAIQFQVNSAAPGSYKVCAKNIAFLDANGAVVEAPEMPPMGGAGGEGGMGGAAGGTGGAAGGTGGAAGGMGGAAGGEGGMGGAAG